MLWIIAICNRHGGLRMPQRSERHRRTAHACGVTLAPPYHQPAQPAPLGSSGSPSPSTITILMVVISSSVSAWLPPCPLHGATRTPGGKAAYLISKSEASRICAALDEPLTAFRTRDHVRFPYVYLDATYCKARVNHQIVSQAVVVATGITEDGGREVLGLMVGDGESEAFWKEFLRSLRERGWPAD